MLILTSLQCLWPCHEHHEQCAPHRSTASSFCPHPQQSAEVPCVLAPRSLCTIHKHHHLNIHHQIEINIQQQIININIVAQFLIKALLNGLTDF